MTMTLDIPRHAIDHARELTRAATDEEAILRAVEAFNARGERAVVDPRTFLLPPVNAAGPPRGQAEAIALLGTFSDFDVPGDEDHHQDLR